SLNLGYSFAAPEKWGTGEVNGGSSNDYSLGASLGWQDGKYGYGGGISLSRSDSRSNQTLLDVNGDGLLDKVRPSGSTALVSFNTGNGFAAETARPGLLTQQLA